MQDYKKDILYPFCHWSHALDNKILIINYKFRKAQK